jgi:hypothetical protein
LGADARSAPSHRLSEIKKKKEPVDILGFCFGNVNDRVGRIVERSAVRNSFILVDEVLRFAMASSG